MSFENILESMILLVVSHVRNVKYIILFYTASQQIINNIYFLSKLSLWKEGGGGSKKCGELFEWLKHRP